MAALLRRAAMLVSRAVCPLRMLLILLARACHTDVEPDRLPARDPGKPAKEETAAASSQTIPALMASSSASNASRHSADVLLPRSGEAPRARTAERSRPGGGPPHRLTTAPPVPHRIVHALPAAHASLPRSGEENRARVTS